MQLKSMLMILAGLTIAVPADAQESYDVAALEAFRVQRDATLRQDSNWLTVAGLHFLNQGENRIGSDPANDIVLNFPSVPRHVGVITVEGRRVRIRAAPGHTLRINDTDTHESDLHGAFDQQPVDTIHFGPVSFFVHYSGERLMIRVRDRQSALRTNFRGLRWFAPDASFRTLGTFTPYPDRKVVHVPNILGDIEPFNAVGTVTFQIAGVEHTVEAWGNPKRLWIVFRDQTSGRETYPSARFLYTPAVEDRKVVIDFNYAQNPPCAYNPYTTCPLPPPQNRLTVPIRAGEQTYHAEPRTDRQ